MFIVLEGINGSGKTTQLELLKQSFYESNYKIIFHKEPGEIFKSLNYFDIFTDVFGKSSVFESLAYAIDRAYYYELHIKPFLDEDNCVILFDRYKLSSFVYQSLKNLDLNWIREINRFFRDPDLYIVLTCDLNELKQRIKIRNREPISNYNFKFLKKVLDLYKKLSCQYNYPEIDTTNLSIFQVHEKIINIINQKFCLKLKCTI